VFDEFTGRKPIAKPRFALAASVAFHVMLLAWILHPAMAGLLTPSSVRFGFKDGAQSSEITTLYWPGKSQESEPKQLAYPARQHHAAKKTPELPAAAEPAGASYGSLGGSMSGPDIRPALPIVSLDPTVPSSELAGVDGDVVVEITIDDKGNIVDKTVVKSLSASIDQRVMAALESWRFRPAMREGTAIPSKQDVFYHFKGAS